MQPAEPGRPAAAGMFAYLWVVSELFEAAFLAAVRLVLAVRADSVLAAIEQAWLRSGRLVAYPFFPPFFIKSQKEVVVQLQDDGE